MEGFTLFLSLTNGALLLVVAAGILARGRWGACRLLPIHLVVGFLVRVPVWIWPDLYDWSYWAVTEAIQTALRCALAVEITYRALRALPNGLAQARRLQMLVPVAAALGLVLSAREPIEILVARANYASAWLFVAFLAMVWYYRIPTEQLHREVALGLTAWALVAGIGPHLREFDGIVGLCSYAVSSLFYPAVLIAWARTAWAPDPPTELSAASLALLRPWRA